ncbi:MAG: hypothetical protein CR997_07975 [Acidobacteria bacterium]|nr:MAG: hypothetical protein CR997_07975 [Acidobacteriota bacterium]
MTDHGIQLFFENYEENLNLLSLEEDLNQIRQRAQIMKSQLGFFQKAVSNQSSAEAGVDIFSLGMLLDVKSIKGFFDWVIHQQSAFNLKHCIYRETTNSWRVLQGTLVPEQVVELENAPIDWLENGKYGKAEFLNQTFYLFFAMSELRLILAGRPKSGSHGNLFVKLVANVFSRMVAPFQLFKKPIVNFSELVATDELSLKLLQSLKKAAPTDVTVLLEGESGTGKEVLANYIHNHSPRKKNDFVAVNCAAIPEGLIESELFGHERGAFTGAVQRHVGKVERAHNGTLFLDEIGEMDLKVQAKLLRFLQLKEFHRVGGKEKISVDVRIIAATNRDLKKAVEEQNFRDDLYFRLSVLPFKIHSLKERPGDILPLFQFFLRRYAKQFKMKVPEVSSRVYDILYAYSFPGNIRELENLIQNLLIQSQGKKITRNHFPESLMDQFSDFELESKPVLYTDEVPLPEKHGINGDSLSTYLDSLTELPRTNDELKRVKHDILEQAKTIQSELERKFLVNLMRECGNSIPEASKQSGINRTMLYKMLDRTGLKS